ncbi:linear amide C-N hydrolase [Halobacillus massiliensis]|uniref:linear amide C-N hydrolase n=1 Tax=Halobacillus massiliensis TaxID=1926286 RepID=UPI0009E3EA22|nr:linear amide C-N hydrolase [Halobacillus massiliensis]
MCTNFSIPRKSGDEAQVSARTYDWCITLPQTQPVVNFVPRGQSFPEIDLPGEIKWKTKYGFIGAGDKKEGYPVAYYDGLNEAGLSAAGLWLSCSEYQKPRKGKCHLYNVNVVSYVLGNFKTIQEVKEGLSKLRILSVDEIYPIIYFLEVRVFWGSFFVAISLGLR